MDLYTLKTHFPPFLAEYFHFEISRRTKKAKIFQPPTFRRKVDEKKELKYSQGSTNLHRLQKFVGMCQHADQFQLAGLGYLLGAVL